MKVTKILIAMLASAFIVTACDPIEDEDLRDKYVTDAGTPITKEALQAAISITTTNNQHHQLEKEHQ